jgi:hypothetical protein
MFSRPPYLQAVIMPAVQSWIAGGLGYFVIDSIATLRDSERPHLVGFAWGMVACTVTWTVLVARWQMIIENILMPNQIITDNKPTVISLVSEDHRQGEYMRLPASRDQLKRLADGLTSGQTFSVNAWAGKDGTFTTKQFSELRSEFIKRGVMEWSNPQAPQQGVKLTRPGMRVMEYIAKG